jgi:hypothetical protein
MEALTCRSHTRRPTEAGQRDVVNLDDFIETMLL